MKKSTEWAWGAQLDSVVCFSSSSRHASWALSYCSPLPGTGLGREQRGLRSERRSATELLFRSLERTHGSLVSHDILSSDGPCRPHSSRALCFFTLPWITNWKRNRWAKVFLATKGKRVKSGSCVGWGRTAVLVCGAAPLASANWGRWATCCLRTPHLIRRESKMERRKWKIVRERQGVEGEKGKE